MAPHDHIHAGGFCRHPFVDLVTRMAQHHDLVDAHLGQPVHLALHRRHRIRKGDVFAGAGQIMGVFGG